MEDLVDSSPADSRRWLYRAMILLGPIGLFVVISLAMWVANWEVGPGIVVQVEPKWQPGEDLALRIQLLDPENQRMNMKKVELFVQGKKTDEPSLLTKLRLIDSGRSAQGNFIVPPLPEGTAVVSANVQTDAATIELQKFNVYVIDSDAKRPSIPPKYPDETALMRADDSDAQPEDLFIDIRPDGRLLAGLSNKLWLRICDRTGIPVPGQVEVVLVHGEFVPEDKAFENKKVLFRGELDSMGLAEVRGKLLSEVIRVEIRLTKKEENVAKNKLPGSSPIIVRKVRLVSRTGATKIHLSPNIQERGHSFSVFAESLQAKNRPIYADLYDEAGRWVNTLSPTLLSDGEKRNWYLPDGLRSSILRVEAYTTLRVRPEIVDVQYLWLREPSENSEVPLERIMDYWVKSLDLVDALGGSEMATKVDRKYIKHLRGQTLDISEKLRAANWLLGTLPIGVSVPPTLPSPLENSQQRLHTKKQSWMTGLRITLYGGGGLLILGLAIVNWLEARALNKRTALVLGESTGSSDYRGVAIFMRSLILLGVMALGLILAGVLLDTFVWGQSEIWR